MGVNDQTKAHTRKWFHPDDVQMDTRYPQGIDTHTRLDQAQKVAHMILADTGTHSSHSLDIEAAYKGAIYTHTDIGKDPRSVVVHNRASGGIHIHMCLGLVYGGRGIA